MHPIFLTQVLAAVVAFGAVVPHSSNRPDEGMWPFDGLPLEQLKDKYGFEPTQEWLDHVRMASVRFDTGGSGSFVSPDGLVMTNHHVALTTLQKISTPEKDWVIDGFSAKKYGSEPKGADLTLRQLVEIKDVTAEVLAVKAADTTEAGNEWPVKAQEMADAFDDEAKHLDADLVPLYDGEQFRIYVYHIYDDVRVVFAPEKQVAYYGGDLDNFTYPRYCLDCAFFRVYEDGKPIDSSKFYFKWNSDGAKKDELVFVSGHPGGTERLLTHAEMEFHRDISVPAIVSFLTRAYDNLKRMMEQNEQAKFQLRDQFFSVSNSLKAYQGHLDGLRNAPMLQKIKARDDALMAKADMPEVKEAFEFIAGEVAKLREQYGGDGFDPRQMMEDMTRVATAVCGDAKSVINKARFAVYGTEMYPDAGFTLRMSYGTVKGYEAGTTQVAPFTTFYGLYNRNLGMSNEAPFDLPAHWLEKKDKIDLSTPYNFVCTADIIGGNSGSPVLNRDAEVVGVIFDGNIESLPGNYWFDERVNRAVSVHTGGMMEAIEEIYSEKELAAELKGTK